MFYRNLSVRITGNKIISQQWGGTPGVYKIFPFLKDTKYKIELIGYETGNCSPYFWIGNMQNRTIIFFKLHNANYINFDCKITGNYKIGLLFKSTKMNDYFFLDDIKTSRIKEKVDNIANKNINNIIENANITNVTNMTNINKITAKNDGEISDDSKNNKSNIISETNIINIKNIFNINRQNLSPKLSKLNYKNKFKISVVIPCHYKHFHFIDKLLKMYGEQTRVPDEIIIILCEANKTSQKNVRMVEEKSYKFKLNIIKLRNKSPAGNNRYLGTKESNGDIIVFQDADDYPHIQRIEIIEYFFYKFPDIVHICHAYSRTNIIKTVNISEIKYEIMKHNIFLNHKEMAKYSLTNGNIAIRKSIMNRVKWELKKFRGQDVAFNRNIYSVYSKFLLIKFPIYIYREQYTTRYLITYGGI